MCECVVLLEIAVFVPRKSDNDKIEDGKEYEKDGVREGVAVKLVNDKESEHDDGGRIRPEFVAQESRDQHRFDEAVAHKVECSKPTGLRKERGHRVLEVGGEEVVRVFNEFVLYEKHRDIR